MEKCKAFFHRFMILLLGATLLSQLSLLPARAHGFSINSITEATSADAITRDLLQLRDSGAPVSNRIEKRFTDAGSHALLARALDSRLVKEGERFICALNNRNYPAASTWTDESSILKYSEGWHSQNLAVSQEVLDTLSPWLNANGLSTSRSDYATIQSRNDRNKPGSSNKQPTGAPMKNIYNLGEGTVIVEDVLNPKAAPALNWALHERMVADIGGEEMWEELFMPTPPRDASGYEIPALTQWSDIAYLQIVHVSGGARSQVQGVKRIVQYHITNPATQAQIREALSTVSKSLSDVNIATGGSAAEFSSDTDACRAIFKTPNGNGGYFLFAQHPEQMGSKTLEKISVFTSPRRQTDSEVGNGEDTSVWYYMAEHFVDAPEQE